MAITFNPDGTTTNFKVENESDIERVKVKRGPKKKFTNPRKTFGASIDLADYESLVKEYGSCTNAMNNLISLWKNNK